MLYRIAIAATLLGAAGPAGAQQPEASPDSWRPLRVAKWSMVGVSLSGALYGFAQNKQADDAYAELERMCQADLQRCGARTPGGAYVDEVLETEFQQIRRLDRRARAGLVLGQAAIATTVVLFILDLRNDRPPPNIPYDGGKLGITATRDGGIALQWRVPM